MSEPLQFVCVTTDQREEQLWVAAASLEDALSAVLEAVPEGWTARPLDDAPYARIHGIHDLLPGEAREISLKLAPRGVVH